MKKRWFRRLLMLAMVLALVSAGVGAADPAKKPIPSESTDEYHYHSDDTTTSGRFLP